MLLYKIERRRGYKNCIINNYKKAHIIYTSTLCKWKIKTSKEQLQLTVSIGNYNMQNILLLAENYCMILFSTVLVLIVKYTLFTMMLCLLMFNYKLS